MSENNNFSSNSSASGIQRTYGNINNINENIIETVSITDAVSAELLNDMQQGILNFPDIAIYQHNNINNNINNNEVYNDNISNNNINTTNNNINNTYSGTSILGHNPILGHNNISVTISETEEQQCVSTTHDHTAMEGGTISNSNTIFNNNNIHCPPSVHGNQEILRGRCTVQGPISLPPVEEIARLRTELSNTKRELESSRVAAESSMRRASELREALEESRHTHTHAHTHTHTILDSSQGFQMPVASMEATILIQLEEKSVQVSELKDTIACISLQHNTQQQHTLADLHTANTQLAQLQVLLHSRVESAREAEQEAKITKCDAEKRETEALKSLENLKEEYINLQGKFEEKTKELENVCVCLSEEREKHSRDALTLSQIDTLREANNELQVELDELRRVGNSGHTHTHTHTH
eukprot:GHVR01058445.1.p1 GENE.GHVR01058445.1~~GHVR01058445.1.p1  ORF type:complete len:414 (-),score=174.65 GHVR01058445.1:116-1357(-)